jgi:hypothetical protein
VRSSLAEKKIGKTGKKAGNGMNLKLKAAFLAAAVLATAGFVFYFGTAVHAAKASGPGSTEQKFAKRGYAKQGSAAQKALASKSLPKSLSLPLFFEPNQGQTAPQVKFLARGSGYGLFLTADEAVLQLQQARPNPRTAADVPAPRPRSVIRMKLDGANSAASVSGAEPLPGKSNYFIGNDPAKWRSNIPQFARVEYKSVYPGVDLVYYGDQGQLEYDFRVAPAADPNQIVLTFQGASAHIVSEDSGDSGDLILSTANGDIRFHAPRVYQPAAPESGDSSGNAEKAIAGSFRQLAYNKIGFTIGDYDHSRELVIDPVLTYSTYLGGSTGAEGLVKVAVDSAGLIYVAGSTTSTDFPLNTFYPNNPPYQAKLEGTQNIFIAVIDPTLVPPQYVVGQQLVYATYLGGSGVDSLAGVAVDSAFSIYVAGTTTSPDFPTNSALTPFQAGPQTGTHGFLSKIGNTSPTTSIIYGLAYSTYLAGNGTDTVTGLAIDSAQNAFVTGVTTSSNPASAGFPANPNAYQTVSNSPGNPQFFASKIYTAGSGFQSMIYSTYFGGAIPAAATAIGGGIAVDPPPASTVNMYITGTTNMLPGTSTTPGFPLFNAYQSCLDQASSNSCNGTNPTNTDAFVAKINPNQVSTSSLVYSTYVGGSSNETGTAIAADSSGNAYITGSTNSTDWVSSGSGFQTAYGGGGDDAFIVKIGGLVGSNYPLTYFTYLGGEGDDIGNDIKVDTVQAAHVAGSTTSTHFPITINTLQPTLIGTQNAFVASIGTSLSGVGAGDFSTYLGGAPSDQGTGVAIDIFGATYVAGTTTSSTFPVTSNPFQSTLPGSPAAFVSQIGASSQLMLSNASTSPSPNPVAAGTQVAFTFDILNMGPDNASDVNFYALLPITGLASNPAAKVTSGTGTCGPVSGNTILCNIPSLVDGGTGAVEVDVTPSITGNYQNSPTLSVSGQASANNGPTQGIRSQSVPVVDFTISASPTRQTVNDGDTATIQVIFCPLNKGGYNATITPSQTTSPSMVTANSPTFNPTTVTLAGSACATTTLSIATVPRPVTTGRLLRRGSFYAAWLPIGGLSLVGLGIGAGRKRRRWLVGALLGLIAGIILLQPGCGSASSTNTTTGGTLAGQYTVSLVGSAGTGASHNYPVTVSVN